MLTPDSKRFCSRSRAPRSRGVYQESEIYGAAALSYINIKSPKGPNPLGQESEWGVGGEGGAIHWEEAETKGMRRRWRTEGGREERKGLELLVGV